MNHKLEPSNSFLARAIGFYRIWRANRLESRGRFASAHLQLARAARLGIPHACFRLGNNYGSGRGCTRSGSEAVRWYEKAAKAGLCDAQFELGVALLADHDLNWCVGPSARWAESLLKKDQNPQSELFPAGLHLSKNDKIAHSWLLAAARAGKPEAQANVGWLYLKGIGCECDRDHALKWLLKAAEKDISQAALGLAEFYSTEVQTVENLEEIIRWRKKAAELGNISAAYQLSIQFSNSESADLREEGERYLEIASIAGHVDASFELGRRRFLLCSTVSEAESAAELIRFSAKKGHVGAAAFLGEIYRRGEKLPIDSQEAARWIRRAADGGHVNSQFEMGCLFARGEGVPQDFVNAAQYFEKSAKGGNHIGAMNIAVFLENGQGITRDISKAIEWYEFAAKGGVSQAQVKLAQHLLNQKSGAAEYKRAHSLLESAGKQNNLDALFLLAQVIANQQGGASISIALEHLRKCVVGGHFAAAEYVLARPTLLGVHREIGLGAVKLVSESAERGVVRAMVLLSRELLQGRYIPADETRAERLLTSASELGDPIAMFELGVYFCNRASEAGDITKGLNLYISAADLGHPVAQYNAGVMLMKNANSEADFLKGQRFLVQAAEQGFDRARGLITDTTP